MFTKYVICIWPLLQLIPRTNTTSQLATLPLLNRLSDLDLIPYKLISIIGYIGHIAFASYGISQQFRYDQEIPWASSLFFQATLFGLLLQPALTIPEARKWLYFSITALVSSIVVLIVGFKLQQTLFMYSYLIVGLVSIAGVFRELLRKRLARKQALNAGLSGSTLRGTGSDPVSSTPTAV